MMQRPQKKSPRTAENHDGTDPDNRPLNREERRALREQDRLMEKRRQARETREGRRAGHTQPQETEPEAPGP